MVAELSELILADVCRDGGSIVADFRRSDGSFTSIMLEVVAIPEIGEPRIFGQLRATTYKEFHHETYDEWKHVAEAVVPKGSDEEAALIADVDQWLSSTTVPEDNRQKILVKDLRHHIPERTGKERG